MDGRVGQMRSGRKDTGSIRETTQKAETMKKIIAVIACLACLISAPSIYEWRVRQTTRVLGGTPMPDVSESREQWERRRLAMSLDGVIRTNETRLAELKSLEMQCVSSMKFNEDFARALNSTTMPPGYLEIATNLILLRSRISDCQIAIMTATQQLAVVR